MSDGKLPPYRTTVMGLLKLPKNEHQIYKNVVTKVYPLQAQLEVLQAFCDNYLNFPDQDDPCPALFKAAAPWVLMQICDYGSMAMDFPGSGVFSQHELAFGFPVEWYDLKDGVYAFRDYVMFYPFIYVDNPLSMGGGREIYGWAKSAVKINRIEPEFDLHKPRVLASISRLEYPGAADFHGLNFSCQHLLAHAPWMRDAPSNTASASARQSGESQSSTRRLLPKLDFLHVQTGPDIAPRSVEFLRVTQSRPLLSGITGLGDAFDTIPRAMGAYLNSLTGMFQTITSVVPPFPTAAPGSPSRARPLSLSELISQCYGYLGRVTPAAMNAVLGNDSRVASSRNKPAMQVVTLKEVRDADDNAHACYQAIVGSSIQVDRSKDAGLLFDPVSPDLSGGIEIQLLHADDDQDVVHQLGIEIQSSCLIGDGAGHTIRPVTPFWANADLSYGPADLQYWRTTQTYWSTTNEPRYTTAAGSENKVKSRPKESTRQPLRYSLLGSGAIEELRGPFTYRKLTTRYLLFKPNVGTFKNLIKQYLQNEFFEFDIPTDGNARLWFVLSDFELQTEGRKGTTGIYEDRQLSIVAPMRWRSAKQPWRPVMVPVCSLVGADWDFITELEVYGRVAIKGTLTSPPNIWIKEPDPASNRTDLLQVATFLFPNKPGGRAADLPLFQVRAAPKNGGAASKAALDQLGLSPFLTHPYHVVSLKQIIDPKEMDCASYQALVAVEREFKIDRAPQKIDNLDLLVTPYECLPILEVLGLNGRGTDPVALHPELTVTISGAMADLGTAKNLCWRAGNGRWQPGLNPFLYSATRG